MVSSLRANPSAPMLQRARSAVFVTALAVGVSAGAAESTVYKVIDPEGKVTYQDHPPDPGTPAVERLEMRTDQNVLKSTPPDTEAAPAEPGATPPPAANPRASQADARSPEARREEAAAIVEKALQDNEALSDEGRDAEPTEAPTDAAAGAP